MKKLTSIVLIFIMLTSVLNVLAYDSESISIEQSIDTLDNLKIIKGYEKSYFNSPERITRDEAFKIIFNLFPPEYENAAKLQEQELFSDITTANSSRNAVTMLGLLGIILGDGDGLVRPNDYILTEEIVAVIVRTLGYHNSETVKKDGFPKGYMNIAKEIGLLRNVKQNIGEYSDRQNFALILYNSLKIPQMVFSQYDASTSLPLYTVDNTKFLQKSILEYNGIPSTTLTLPGNSGSFYYKFGIMNKQYSAFLITPTDNDTGIRIKFKATNADHTVRLEIIDKDSDTMVYCSEYISVLKDFEQELYLSSEYFSKSHDYYIKLYYPSFAEAGGFMEISE